jgi:TRAP-type mannitol/chloroaromatic compound transport system permease small subunit
VAQDTPGKAVAAKADHVRLPETALSRAVDPPIEWIARASAVLWPVLVAVITVNVLMRYVLGRGLIEFEEIQWHLYAAGFLLAQAWCLLVNAHVRVDVLAEHLRNRTKCWIELACLLFWLLPFVLFVLWYSLPFVAYSFRIGEISEAPGGLPYRFAIKAFLALGFLLLTAATLSRLTRVIAALRSRG